MKPLINCQYNSLCKPGELKPHPRNTNNHSDEQVNLLVKLIGFQGWRHPVIVSNLSGFIVAGHCRWMAAKNQDWDVPVQFQDFDGSEQEYAFLESDNHIAELADHDLALMWKNLEELPQLLDLQLLGFPDLQWPDVEKLEPGCDEDEVPEVKESRVKKGDLWELGNHRLLCGDSTMIDEVERLMGGDKADMVFTDPPYGINESAAKRSTRETNSLAKSNSHLKEFLDDSTQYAIDFFNYCQSVQIPFQVWFGANYYCHSIPQSNNWLVWDKRVEDHQRDNNSDCELAWVQDSHSSVRIFRHLWKGLIKGSENGERRVHPTQKPIALAEWCFEKYGNPKTVLDGFGGSGSILIACEKTKRKCFMMEIDPHYCTVIMDRWEKFTGKKAILTQG